MSASLRSRLLSGLKALKPGENLELALPCASGNGRVTYRLTKGTDGLFVYDRLHSRVPDHVITYRGLCVERALQFLTQDL